MTIWDAIFLGIIQGLTEFLPVSSSGHLELANYFLGINDGNNLQFAMVVHLGTVLSTIVVFGRELGRLLKGFFSFKLNDETIYVINILISLVPVLFVGLFFKDKIEAAFTDNLLLVGLMMMVTALLLLLSHITRRHSLHITPARAFIIGIAQAIAVLPGLSRSGATIATGLMIGVKKEEVAKFSFLMVLIPIIGMNLLDIVHHKVSGGLPVSTLLAGFLTAFATGILACRWMVRLVSRGRMVGFAAYCGIVGILSVIVYLWN